MSLLFKVAPFAALPFGLALASAGCLAPASGEAEEGPVGVAASQLLPGQTLPPAQGGSGTGSPSTGSPGTGSPGTGSPGTPVTSVGIGDVPGEYGSVPGEYSGGPPASFGGAPASGLPDQGMLGYWMDQGLQVPHMALTGETSPLFVGNWGASGGTPYPQSGNAWGTYPTAGGINGSGSSGSPSSSGSGSSSSSSGGGLGP